MVSEEILKERERCKNLVETRIDAIIKWREENVKPYKRHTWILDRIKKRLIFLIENPDYKKTGNLKNFNSYNTWKNLEKGKIKYTPPKEESEE